MVASHDWYRAENDDERKQGQQPLTLRGFGHWLNDYFGFFRSTIRYRIREMAARVDKSKGR